MRIREMPDNREPLKSLADEADDMLSRVTMRHGPNRIPLLFLDVPVLVCGPNEAAAVMGTAGWGTYPVLDWLTETVLKKLWPADPEETFKVIG